VKHPLSLGLQDLKNMRSETLVVTLECAGNGRSLLDPPIEGEKWDLGAVSTAEWTGVPLAEVLERAGIEAGACEVLFRGVDRGTVPGRTGPVHFERSLTLNDASSSILLAYAMNGEPLPIQHGYPLRVIVPSWYAVTSVKWLTEIEVIDKPFTGHYQTDVYVYEWKRTGRWCGSPSPCSAYGA
jgi:DMSO/TMAO reductase YedYZ molybdopterin-dependent catalytic subunit